MKTKLQTAKTRFSQPVSSYSCRCLLLPSEAFRAEQVSPEPVRNITGHSVEVRLVKSDPRENRYFQI